MMQIRPRRPNPAVPAAGPLAGSQPSPVIADRAQPTTGFDALKQRSAVLLTGLRESKAVRVLPRLALAGLGIFGVSQFWLRRDVRQQAARGFGRLADAVEAKGTSRPAPAAEPTVVAPAHVTELSAARASPAELRKAAESLLALYDRPGRDEAFRDELKAFLRTEAGLDDAAIERLETRAKPEMPVRFEFVEKAQALAPLAADDSVPESLRLLAVKRLGKVGGDDVQPMLKSLATGNSGSALAKAATKAARDIQKAQKLEIVLCSWEVKPYVGGGGLGNVMAELPRALAKMGHNVTVLTPLHASTAGHSEEGYRPGLKPTGKTGLVMGPDGAEKFHLVEEKVPLEKKEGEKPPGSLRVVFIENDRYFSKDRAGIYGDENGPYEDSARRYDFFGAAEPVAIRALFPKKAPDIIQENDAHTGTGPVYLKNDEFFAKTKVVYGLHNVGGAYQGRYSAEELPHLRFDGLGDFRHGDESSPVEFHGDINLLKYGMMMSDLSVAVSNQYMHEILQPEKGEGLHGVFQALHAQGRLFGNLNGIDNSKWDPRTDKAITQNFSIDDLSGKAACKEAVQRGLTYDKDEGEEKEPVAHGLPVKPGTPLVGVVCRIDREQKAVDEVIARVRKAIDTNEDVQFVVCGEGDPELCAELRALASERPDILDFYSKFSPKKERQILAGCDFFLMPSRREPCGLPQMYALRYLTAPIVRGVGGLEESIQDFDASTGKGNGFKFQSDIDEALSRALSLYREQGDGERGDGMRQLLQNAAASDFGWETTSALEQVALYRLAMDDEQS